MSTQTVTYLGEGKVVAPAVELRRWPVQPGELPVRRLPEGWSERDAAEAVHWGLALNTLVTLAEERRAVVSSEHNQGMRGRCSSATLELLTGVFPAGRVVRQSGVVVSVGRVKVAMTDLVPIRREGRAEQPDSLEDELMVGWDDEWLRMRVAPLGLGRSEAELYSSLRAEGSGVDEALELVALLVGS